jgi:hypothetical protein
VSEERDIHVPEQRGLGAALPGVAANLPEGEFSLLELADRLLHKGVVLVGEATISVAGVDLVYLGLNVVLTAVENLRVKPGDNPGRSTDSSSASTSGSTPSAGSLPEAAG